MIGNLIQDDRDESDSVDSSEPNPEDSADRRTTMVGTKLKQPMANTANSNRMTLNEQMLLKQKIAQVKKIDLLNSSEGGTTTYFKDTEVDYLADITMRTSIKDKSLFSAVNHE